MKSKLLFGGLCAAVALAVAAPAMAQEADIFTGKIAPEVIKAFTIDTDASTIIELTAIAHNAKTDLDILITTGTGDDEEILVDAKSGVFQLEKAAVGLLGATTYKVAITNVAGPNSRFVAMFTTPSSTGVTQGARIRVREAGEFGIDEPVGNPEFAGLQRLVRERVAAKRR